MTTTYLVRGMLIGIVAGALSFGFAKIFGEPQVEQAIAFEEQQSSHASHDHHHMDHGANTAVDEHKEKQEAEEPELVSRNVQSGLGLFIAVTVYGVAMGGLFALVFASTYGRVGPVQPRNLALVLAGIGFLTIIIVPTLKYPPNPPAVGLGETIGLRTATYFLMIATSIGAAIFATIIKSRLTRTLDSWNATLVGVITFVVIMAVAFLIFPSINEVPKAFSADVLWRFRIASIGTQAVLWITIGVLFGIFTERNLRQN